MREERAAQREHEIQQREHEKEQQLLENQKLEAEERRVTMEAEREQKLMQHEKEMLQLRIASASQQGSQTSTPQYPSHRFPVRDICRYIPNKGRCESNWIHEPFWWQAIQHYSSFGGHGSHLPRYEKGSSNDLWYNYTRWTEPVLQSYAVRKGNSDSVSRLPSLQLISVNREGRDTEDRWWSTRLDASYSAAEVLSSRVSGTL